MKFKDKLIFNIVVPLFAITLIGLVALYFIISFVTSDSIMKSEQVSLEHKFNTMNGIVADELDELVTDVISFSNGVFSLDTSKPAELKNITERLQDMYEVDNVAVVYTDGTPITATANSVFETVSEKKAIASAVANKPIGVITSVHDMLMMTVAGKKNSVSGEPVIIIFQKLITSDKFLSTNAKLLECDLTVFSGMKRVATTVKDTEGKSLVGTTITNQDIYNTVFIQNEPYSGIVENGGLKYFSMYAQFPTDDPGSEVMVFAGVDDTHANEITTTLVKFIILSVAGIILVMSLALIYVLMTKVLRPVNKTISAFKNLNSATETADLTQRINVKVHNELGEICKNVNTFIESQHDIMKEVDECGTSLQSVGETLASASQQSAGAIQEVMANINSVKSSVSKQTNALDSVQNVLNSNIKGITNLDQLIENQSAGIVESSASIEEMVGNISSVSNSVNKMAEEYQTLIKIVKNGKQRQDDVAVNVNTMAQQSEHLAEANSVISQIAEQTNLLAMNAAIEAAHAGEAGKGFSVVADEIRKLAENSAEQSKAIKLELDNISKSINSVVKASEISVEDFVQISDKVVSTERLVREIDNAMVEQKEASHQVLQALHEINDATTNVQSTSKQMANDVNSAKEQADNLEIISRTVEGAMNEMSLGINEITIAAHHVSDMANSTRENIDVLDKLLSKFTL